MKPFPPASLSDDVQRIFSIHASLLASVIPGSSFTPCSLKDLFFPPFAHLPFLSPSIFFFLTFFFFLLLSLCYKIMMLLVNSFGAENNLCTTLKPKAWIDKFGLYLKKYRIRLFKKIETELQNKKRIR